MCTASIRDVMQQFTQKQPNQNPDGSSLLIHRRDADGRPVGRGGNRKERKIMDLVEQAQGLKIPE